MLFFKEISQDKTPFIILYLFSLYLLVAIKITVIIKEIILEINTGIFFRFDTLKLSLKR